MTCKSLSLINNICKLKTVNKILPVAMETISFWEVIFNFNQKQLQQNSKLLSDLYDRYGKQEIFICFKKITSGQYIILADFKLDTILSNILRMNKNIESEIPISPAELRKIKNDSIRFTNDPYLIDYVCIDNKVFKVHSKLEFFLKNGFSDYIDRTILPYITETNCTKLELIENITVIYKFKIEYQSDRLTDNQLISIFELPIVKKKRKTISSTTSTSTSTSTTTTTSTDNSVFQGGENSDIEEDHIDTIQPPCTTITSKTIKHNILKTPIIPPIDIEYVISVKASEEKYIKYLIYDLYRNNKKFKDLVDKYPLLVILKGIHSDINKLNSNHVTGFLKSKKMGLITETFHFYIKNNKISRLTSLLNYI